MNLLKLDMPLPGASFLPHMLGLAGLLLLASPASALAQRFTTEVVVVNTEENSDFSRRPQGGDPNAKPAMSKFLVRSDVQFRYARTVVQSYVENPASRAQMVTFSVVIPDTAFVSNFSMIIDNKEFVAEVKKKDEAQETFDNAVEAGRGAGLVRQNLRDANLIVVSTNVEAGSKVRFSLTYEELLSRKLGRYEHIIHVNPGQIVDDFIVDVFINESLPIENVVVPRLKTDPNSLTSEESNPFATILGEEQPNNVNIQFVANRTVQEKMNADGVNGQFIVQYDVGTHNENGDIQLLDGYFVHFFSPDNTTCTKLPVHVVFVLDISGSMEGAKLDQTKDAMVTILDDMTGQDYFNIITFNSCVDTWKSRAEEVNPGLAYRGTKALRDEALRYTLQLGAEGLTDINDALKTALDLIKNVQQAAQFPDTVHPMIIFLTDGMPTIGVTNINQIVANVNEANKELDIPIYGLAFGEGADFDLLKKLSLANNAFARRIYEGSDGALQLEDFFSQVENPLLSEVEFDYVGERVETASIARSGFGPFNRGNDIVIAGRLKEGNDEEEVEVVIRGKRQRRFERRIRICLRRRPLKRCIRPVPPPKWKQQPRSNHENFVERLWAFLSIKQYLRDGQTESQARRQELNGDSQNPGPRQKKSNKEMAVELALQYNFVTPLTSLLVLRPDGKSTSNIKPVRSQSPPPPPRSFGPRRSRGRSQNRGNRSNLRAFIGQRFGPLPPQTGGRGGGPACQPRLALNSGQRSTGVRRPKILKISSCSGKITLYSQTYRRGKKAVELDKNESDLSRLNYDNLLKSLEVDGNCCWGVYADRGFQGAFEVFRPGRYDSATQLADLVNDASSVAMVVEC